MPRPRRGFTLVELLMVIVMLALVAVSVSRILVGGMRTSQAQLQQAGLQANVRTGGLVLPLELREIGYDSNITTAAVTSDIDLMGPTWIQFRAMRGIGFTCGTPSLTELRVRAPVLGFRSPLLTDGFLLYVENDPNTGMDDQWLPMTVTAIHLNSTCGADGAIRLTITPPKVTPGGADIALSNIFVGGPVRFYERVRFGAFVDADGLTYLGARSLSLGEAAYRAVAGPLDPVAGLQLTYYSRSGEVLDPAAANPVDVRRLDIVLAGLTRQGVNLAGAAQRQVSRMTTQTTVALRNTLLH